MKKLLFLTTSPVIDGNGDALIDTAMNAAQGQGIITERINVREKTVNPCKACYQCASNGICIQNDDFKVILKKIHEADAIMMTAPIYYNCMAAQALLVINRLCCTFACKNYKLGSKKKVAVMLTCTGSEENEMKRHVKNILTLPSISRAISEYRTEVFRGCISSSTCKESEEYLERAREIGCWMKSEEK